MTKSRYVHSIALNEQEETLVLKLKAKGISQAEIFRQGLALCEKAGENLKVPKGLIKKAKEIV